MASRMWWNKASLVASIALVCGCVVLQQAPAAVQDQGPILTPKPKPQTSASPTLLVLCDLTCDWKLDGVAQGRIEGGASAKVKVELGQHLVVVVSASNSRDRIERMVEVKGVGQTLVNLKLEPIRDARLQAEQNASQQQQTTQQQTTSQTQQSALPRSDDSVWTDPATGLMWTRHDNNADANWNEAGSYCQNLRLDGYSDWQLPTVQDLQGILDLSQSSTCGTETCHIKGNIQLTTKWVWTSTPGSGPGQAMYFRFSEGQYLSYPYSDRQLDRVLCVRPAGSAASQSASTGVPSGAVWIDPATGLMWQRSDSGDNNDLTWQQAVNYCRSNSAGGYSDWRLPSVDEFLGIYDTSQSVQYSCCGGTSSGVMHVKGGIQMSGEEWTSSEGNDGNGAYRIWLSDSSHSVWTKTESYEGRGICVRAAR